MAGHHAALGRAEQAVDDARQELAIVPYHPTRAERLKGLAHTICEHLQMPSAATFCPQ